MTERRSFDPHWLTIAQRCADAAAEVHRRWFRSLPGVHHKEDTSPIVTIADQEAERAMRTILEAALPSHGIYGEEEGATRLDADHIWVLDPIDGTIAFASGKPIFATLIALVIDGEPVLGIIDQAITRERWIGTPDGTTFNGTPVHTRSVPLSEARLGSTTPVGFQPAQRAALNALAAEAHVTTWGGDAYNYALLASGHLELVIEKGLEWYDWAALVPVVRGAGGIITDWTGQPPTDRDDQHLIAAGSPELHAQAVARFGRLQEG